MTGLYRIRVVKHCKRSEVILSYTAPTHPNDGEIIWHRDRRYVVTSVSHVVDTLDVGSCNETNKLGFVELEVLT